jgi:hypothetical protein
MPRELFVINSQHYIGNSQFRYTFPGMQHFDENSKVSVYSVSCYNSTFNITALNQNNRFSIRWRGNEQVFVIPDGYYSYDDFSKVIAQVCLDQGFYMIDTANNNRPLYFITCQENKVNYSAQINVNFIPAVGDIYNATTNPGGLRYILPPNATWTLPQTRECPQFRISSPNLYSYFGLNNAVDGDIFPPTAQTNNYVKLSSGFPIVSPCYAYSFLCNLCENRKSACPDLLFQLPLTAGFGEILTYSTAFPVSCDIRLGSYQHITITLKDQNLVNPLQLRDLELSMILIIETP